MPTRALSVVAAAADTSDGGLPRRWSGPIGFEGQLTGDGRLIDTNALTWDLPIPLRYVVEDVGQHMGAQVVGTIETLERGSKGQIIGSGTFDLEGSAGREAARQVHGELTNGISMDLDSVAFEIRVAGELAEYLKSLYGDGPEEPIEPEVEEDDEGRVIVAKVDPEDEVQVTTSARIRAATLVAIPAFADAKITADLGSLETPEEDPDASSGVGDEEEDSITAGATTSALPPATWFEDPRLKSPTALQVTEDGQVFGHLALWGTCHIGHSGGGECVTPPHSQTGYSYFRTGVIRTREGKDVPVGHLTLDTSHAPSAASPAVTMAHYENTGATVADVAVGEDSHGIWVSGSVRSLSDDQLRSLRSAPLSGDWRRIGGNLELVAALAVNVPGFPVPRMAGLVASGELTSLVAAGMVTHHSLPSSTVEGLTSDDLRYLRRAIRRERENEKRVQMSAQLAPEAAALSRRVRGTQLALKVRRSKSAVGRI